MTTATIRLPVRSALVQAPPYPTHGVEVLASIRLDLLADALRSMEHNDTDPGEKRMNANQCRDALLRELLGGWSPSELVEAKIPGVLQMADEIATLRRERDEARAGLHPLAPHLDLEAEAEAMSGVGVEDLVEAVNIAYRENRDTDHREALHEFVGGRNINLINLRKMALAPCAMEGK